MNNPLNTLRSLISPSQATRGVVVAVAGGLAKVATPRGLVEAPAVEGLVPGQQVSISAGGQLSVNSAASQTYWL